MSTTTSRITLPASMAAANSAALGHNVLLGSIKQQSPRCGIIGKASNDFDKIVAMDLNAMSCVSLFGEPGVGKSYTMGIILENALAHCRGINLLPEPLCVVVFHYSGTQAYKPEFCASFAPNDVPEEISALEKTYNAKPVGIPNVHLLAPSAMVPTRRIEFPGVGASDLVFPSHSLAAIHWQILMGALGEEDTPYLQVMNRILRQERSAATISSIRSLVTDSYLPQADKDRAFIRLDLASEYIRDPSPTIASYIKPGSMIIVDLRDEYLKKKEALALFFCLLQLISDATLPDGRPFHKMVVFDEFHKYAQDPVLVDGIIESIREMRHKSVSTLIASQDPPSVPLPAIELSTMVVALKMTSSLWNDHIRRVKTPFKEVTDTQMARLNIGEAMVWSKFASDEAYMTKPQLLRLRPRFSKHGGNTKGLIATGS